MEMASFAGFIQTLFYILFIYYVLKFLARLFLPYMVKKVVEKAGQNFQQQHQNQQNNSNTKESNTTDSKPRENKKVGEYVDFEEIE
jgi:bacteriorhodopsin